MVGIIMSLVQEITQPCIHMCQILLSSQVYLNHNGGLEEIELIN